jgi:hypothetical protein
MLETIKLILALIPIIVETARKLEEQFPESNLGKLKATLILESLVVVFGDGKETVALIEKILNGVVNTLNIFGIFKK